MTSYDLHEFDKDKVFTGEVDPTKIVPIKYQPYDKNSLGQTIIDSNKNINGLRYNIGLNTKKVSQQKFDQVIDIEFEEFLPRIIDNTVADLKDQVAELEAIKAELQVTNTNDQSKIINLNEQIRILEEKLEAAAVIVTPTGEVSNATISDTLMAGAILTSGTSKDRLLSKNKKAVAIIQTSGIFEIYTGDFDGLGNLKPGAESQLIFRQGDPKNVSDTAAADPTTYMTPVEKLNKAKADVAAYTKTLDTLGKLQTNLYSIQDNNNTNSSTYGNSLTSANALIYSQAKSAAAIDINLRSYNARSMLFGVGNTSYGSLSNIINYTLKSNNTDPAFQNGIFNFDLQRRYALERYRDDIITAQKILKDLIAKQTQYEAEIANQSAVVTTPQKAYFFWIWDFKPSKTQTQGERYLENNPDVARDKKYGKAPRQHFDDFGNKENRYWPGEHGHLEIGITSPWRPQWGTGRLNLNKESRVFLDDGGTLSVYQGDSVVWSTYALR
jgi:hypothetical protein